LDFFFPFERFANTINFNMNFRKIKLWWKGDREVKLLALKGGLPGKVVLHIVPLDPTLKGGACGARSGQD
jgi:hypothetical protein